VAGALPALGPTRTLAAAAPDHAGGPRLRPRGSNQIGMRQYNERIVLRAIRLHGALPQAGLARLTTTCSSSSGRSGFVHRGAEPLALGPVISSMPMLEQRIQQQFFDSADLKYAAAEILARPIASAGMIAAELGVTPRAAQDMVAELGLREMTGRGRYRAWGIL